ncbi:MAG: HesA/MoeB/ThiF family protein [Proteobacteria bacterium]|nr:HesA/MoeB/ThiF family protein [Pseudomonadota bacterium]
MSLAARLREKSQDNILLFADALILAEQCNVDLLKLEQTALENNIWPERYQRHRDIFSPAQQHQLLVSIVAIVGCGGLGGQVFEEFIRLGVGRIIAIDPDCFAAHNLNRQLLCTVEELGRFKVQAAVRRARSVNPAVQVTPLAQSFSVDIHNEVRQAQVVIDCLDSVADRHELAEFCRSSRIPLVHGAVEKWFGQIGVQKKSNLIKNLYPQIPPQDKITIPSVLSCTVAAVASLQVAETIKLLLHLDSPLRDNWKSVDLLNCEIEALDAQP